ncbi:MAG: right-handed parallel beta-helix repeat-containing protein, partial [Sedimentisphaerales bacterium]
MKNIKILCLSALVAKKEKKMSHQHPLILSLIITIASFPITAKANSLEGSTSPYILNAELYSSQQYEIDTNVITFSEFPVDTNITNQYANRGVIFGTDGNIPFITTDSANPTSPVLSGTPRFTGPIEGRFVNPNDGVTPIVVSAFSFDAGYFDTNGSTLIEWFDPNNNKLGEQTNSIIGIQHFNIGGCNIARWRISIIGSEPAGFAIDNLKIDLRNWDLNKVADVNNGDCVLPGREITYTITYNSNCTGDTNVALIDYLPVEVDYNSSSPEGDYDPAARTVTWNIGTVPLDSNGTFLLKVNVNNLAEPCGVITNTCELGGDHTYGLAEENTPVCAWNAGVIYVDCNRTGGKNNGMSWQDAYLDLQNALNRASIGGGSQIWVAKGTYKPSIPDPCNTSYGLIFKLINGVPLYGHFAGNETSLSQRNLSDQNNETILSGTYNYLVTASGFSQNNILDGFTITGGYYSRIAIFNAYLTVSNCFINGAGNIYGGISEAGSGSARIVDCIICNNGPGIFFDSSSSNLTVVTGCKIFANTSFAISIIGPSNYDIHDSWIYRNGGEGIYFYPTTGLTTIRNNTIFGNKSWGIACGSSIKPIITSSIIWGNSSGDLSGCSGSYLW